MAILPILFIVILEFNQVRKQRIADKYNSHSHEVTGNAQYFRVNKFGNRSLSHCLIADANILLAKVPSNMTHLFQPLDFTVNSWAKNFMREKFADW